MAARLAWEPLEYQLMQVLRREDIAVNVVQMARRLDRDTQTIYYYRQGRDLNVWAADRYACRIGLHPALVWGNDWWDAITADMDRTSGSRKKVSHQADS